MISLLSGSTEYGSDHVFPCCEPQRAHGSVPSAGRREAGYPRNRASYRRLDAIYYKLPVRPDFQTGISRHDWLECYQARENMVMVCNPTKNDGATRPPRQVERKAAIPVHGEGHSGRRARLYCRAPRAPQCDCLISRRGGPCV